MKRKIVSLILVIVFTVAMTSGVSAAGPGSGPGVSMAGQQYQLEFDDIQPFMIKSATGMESTIGVMAVKAGSDAKGGVKNPTMVSFSNLIISRPFVQDSVLLNWNDSVIKGVNDRKDGCLTVVDRTGKPILKYNIYNVWPCRYTIKTEDLIMIEEMELVIGSAEFESPKSN